ncbi:peptidoglycan/LPS O-acetylase OafA/YrhL [Bacillus ectoiniformans]|uniref:acyltransferase n=1 Tax=Bacillus ectoiniformans TaxID=1494429 RepID=UPI00195A8D16|nr:acyltransferase [Bacillus ectoiniformans]MBM7649889.1 peptidoglycan/LPS O-acetylase OafA/YrhL [Bacillus ectoiniformans]
MNKARGHIFEIHFLRAFACLCVLAVHVSASFYKEHGQQFNEFTYFFNQISRFGTPLFAVISGFLLVYQMRFKGFHFNKFVSSRFTKIGLPFLFWSVFYLVFLFIKQGTNPFDAGLSTFIGNFLSGNSFYHLYFMAIVFQFYLVFPLLQIFRSKVSWSILIALAAGAHIYFLNSYTHQPYEGIWKMVLNPQTFLPNWMFFFIFGGFLAYHWESLEQFSKKYKTILGVATLAVVVGAVIEYKTAGLIGASRETNMINIPIITLFVMGIAEDLQKVRLLNRFLKKVGTLSMAIYLVHPFVISMFHLIAPDFIWHTALFPVVYAIILLGSIAMVSLIQLLPYNQYILTVPKMKPRQKNINSSKKKLAI